MATTKAIFYSDDNGQMACEACAPLYGRISWHRMSAAEQVSMRAELSDILRPEEPLCEMCRGRARRANANGTIGVAGTR
jgi:hypothetical protein